MDKLNAKKPDVVMFNGYANQYKANPITVKRGERIRLYVLNAGPSLWSAFHVIGTVFEASFTTDETQRSHVLPHITGSAYVTAEATFIFDDADPLCWGII